MKTNKITATLSAYWLEDGKYRGGYDILDIEYGPGEKLMYKVLMQMPWKPNPEWTELDINGEPNNSNRLDVSVDPQYLKDCVIARKTMSFLEFTKKWEHDHRGKLNGKKFGF